VDIRDTSLALAKQLGADVAINSTSSQSVNDIITATEGGVHASIVLSESQDSLDIAASITKKHGTVCLVAAVSDSLTIRLALRI
jgi:D-arabinose 1-dehydrogenase-like Zn-dependent alcohol dehydrogenase